jgi:hypothetical protein
VRVMFAALHGRVVGTFKTCRRHWEMSGFESKADLGQNLPDLVKCFSAHNSKGPRLIQVNGQWLSHRRRA